jgi:hypothetical protein
MVVCNNVIENMVATISARILDDIYTTVLRQVSIELPLH